MNNDKLDDLQEGLKQLPGIGAKTAERLAFFLISGNKQTALDLANLIRETVNSIQKCQICGMLSQTSPCKYCSNEERTDSLLCVVEKSQDVHLIDKIKDYNGKFFVLGNLLSPLDGIGPKHINFSKLKKLVKSKNIDELILALNPSNEGESTMSFLTKELKDDVKRISRLATGLPVGGDIEFTTSKTLESAFNNRKEM